MMRTGFLEPVPPPMGFCIISLKSSFIIQSFVCMCMVACMNINTHLPHPLRRWRRVLWSRRKPPPQSSPQPQRKSFLNSTFEQCVWPTFGSSPPLQIPGLDQLWSLVDRNTERETQEYNTSGLVACVDWLPAHSFGYGSFPRSCTGKRDEFLAVQDLQIPICTSHGASHTSI